jgi:hypothetical protein
VRAAPGGPAATLRSHVSAEKPVFVVARNPDEASSLGFLLRIPVGSEIVTLKARARWPTTARVYCHPLDQWPADAEVLEEVAIRSCARRGPAVDLVLDRARENRSQIVFTEPNANRAGGRPMIFWQTARTARRARPGQRVPTRRASELQQMTIVVDTRTSAGRSSTARSPISSRRSGRTASWPPRSCSPAARHRRIRPRAG